MVDRSVVISLIANVGAYVAGMGRAAAATAGVGRGAQTAMAQASQAYTRAGGSLDRLSRTAKLSAAALALGLGASVKVAADFDAKMATVRANVDLNGVSFDKLTDAVKTQGQQFGFTALQSADAADDLAKAGLTASQIMGGGLVGALTLAAAGNISAGDAAETAATAMTMFGKSSKDIPHIADLLAAGADKSTASVSSLSEGLMEGGSLAHLMGVSIEDTTSILAEFDQSGLKGAKAGNALKTMFQNMLAPSNKQLDVMKKLNLNFFDANGKFIGLAATADELKEKLGGLSDKQRNAALSILFGARSIQAANILYKDGGDKIKEWQKDVDDSGFAAKNAAKKLDSLKGDLNKLKSAAVELAINGGAAATNFLRPLAKGATDTIKALAGLPEGVQTLGLGLLTAGAGLTALAVGAVKTVNWVRDMRTQWRAARDAVKAYTSAQVAARAAAEATRDTEAIRAGTIAANERRFSRQGQALMTLASGQRIALGRVGTAVALLGRRAIPTLGAIQVAYYGAEGAAAKFAATSKAALIGAGKAAGIVAVAAAIAYGLKQLRDYIATSNVADVETKKLGDSLSSLASGTAKGGIADVFREQGSAVKLWGHQIGAQREKVVSTSDVIKRFGEDLKTVNMNDFLKGFNALGLYGHNMEAAKKQLRELDSALASLVKRGKVDEAKKVFAQLTKGMSPEKIAQAKKALSGYTQALKSVPKETKPVESETRRAADAIEQMGHKSKQSKDDVDALAQSIKGLGDAQLGVRGSARGYQQAIDDATEALKKNGKTLDITTAKGRDNQEKLDAIASSTTDWAASQVKLTGNMRQANAILQTGKKRYIATAVAMGMGRDKAKALADQIFKLPKSVKTSVRLDGAEDAIYKVDHLGNLVVSMDGKKVTIPADAPNAAQTANILFSVRDAAVSSNGKKVTIPTKAIKSRETLDALLSIKGARLKADGSVSIPTKALDAAKTAGLLGNLGRLAVDADGKEVIIPASLPGGKALLELIGQIHGAQVRTDGKKVVITSKAPFADDVRRKIDKIRGAQVTANGKKVVIDSSIPKYGSVLAKIRGLIEAARDKTFTITARFAEQNAGGANLARHYLGFGVNARGGIWDGGVQKMAAGAVRGPMVSSKPILWGEAGPEAYIPLSHDSRRRRSIDLTRAVADFYDLDVIPRGVRHAAAGYISHARPATFGLSDRDLARLAVAMGGRSVENNHPTYVDTIITADYQSFIREQQETQRREALAGRR